MPASVHLPAETEERLDALSIRTGRSKAFFISQMIENGIDDLEDYYLAVEVMERLKRGEEEILSHEDFWRGLD